MLQTENMKDFVKLGVQTLDKTAREKLSQYLQSQQKSDGGFSNELDISSDLYYTFFALTCMLGLGIKPLNLPRLLKFLYLYLDKKFEDIVHLSAWARCWKIIDIMGNNKFIFSQQLLCSLYHFFSSIKKNGMKKKILSKINDTLPTFQSREEISYFYSSIYDNFLVSQLYQSLGWNIPQNWDILKFFSACENSSGGFSNKPNSSISTVPNTTAAILLAQSFDIKIDSQHIDWLENMFDFNMGGFRASSSSPYPDLLSTATALCCLKIIGHDIQKFFELAEDFIVSHWIEETGGFGNTLYSQTSDIEYTFYALLGLGCLADKEKRDT